MHKITSMRLDEELKEYMSTFDAEYGFKSLGALVNGFFYYAKHGTNPADLDVKRFLEAVLDGDLVTPDQLERKVELQRSRELDLFFIYMGDHWGNAMLGNFIRHGIRYYMEKPGWLDTIRREFCNLHDIPLYPWEVRRYLQLWYDRADDSGRLREINRCIILNKPITEQTFLDCSPAEVNNGEAR